MPARGEVLYRERLAELLAFESAQDPQVDTTVAAILADVKQRGDAAVLEYTARFDGVKADTLAALEIPQSELQAALAPESAQDVAVLLLTHVNYRTGAMHDMAALTVVAHRAGVLTVWDLAHSAGALPVDLNTAGADFAVGCGYKYLNGGPGAPAFVWAHRRHVDHAWQPLAGWIGHAAPFEFTPDYRPAPGISRYLCGTPPVLSLAALECGVDTVLAAEPLGGMAALRTKSLALTRLFAELVQARCAGHGLRLVSPTDDEQRGSQVCLARVLLKQPALLALDEATSALDQTTEVLFQRVLEEKFQETTILCIAHRLETLRWCRTRIEMGTGKLLSISDFNPDSAALHH
jgi:kynureninase